MFSDAIRKWLGKRECFHAHHNCGCLERIETLLVAQLVVLEQIRDKIGPVTSGNAVGGTMTFSAPVSRQ